MDAAVRAVKEWVGSLADDTQIAEALADLGQPNVAALSILRQRRADMVLNMGGSLSVYRDVTIQITAEQLAGVDLIIGQLEGVLGVGASQVSVAGLTRRSERHLRGIYERYDPNPTLFGR